MPKPQKPTPTPINPKDRAITLVLSLTDVETVLSGLNELPHKIVAALFTHIRDTALAQANAPVPNPEAEPEPEPDPSDFDPDPDPLAPPEATQANGAEFKRSH